MTNPRTMNGSAMHAATSFDTWCRRAVLLAVLGVLAASSTAAAQVTYGPYTFPDTTNSWSTSVAFAGRACAGAFAYPAGECAANVVGHTPAVCIGNLNSGLAVATGQPCSSSEYAEFTFSNTQITNVVGPDVIVFVTRFSTDGVAVSVETAPGTFSPFLVWSADEQLLLAAGTGCDGSPLVAAPVDLTRFGLAAGFQTTRIRVASANSTGSCGADLTMVGVPNGLICTADPQCNDGNPCTTDTCAEGSCGYAPSGALGCGPVVSCDDEEQNGDETDVDCGGDSCDPCDDDESCVLAADCTSAVCSLAVCQAPTCSDTVQNGTESDQDCGGSCTDCVNGDSCGVAGDCASGVCTGSICQVPTCSDTVQNGTETDQDCGGSCDPCDDDEGCGVAGDCTSGVCTGSLCLAPTCIDTVQNGTETDQDCGGSCDPCDDDEGCGVAGDCTSGVCIDSTCLAPTCTDDVQNGTESDEDCGGSCGDCADGDSCGVADDCASEVCTSSVCQCIDSDGDEVCDSDDPCAGNNSSGDSDDDGICDNLDDRALVQAEPFTGEQGSCSAGGVALLVGLDGDNSGELEPSELTTTSYVCNGVLGNGALVSGENLEPASAQCPSGGVRLSIGLDDDGDGELDAEEVGSEHVICSGQQSLVKLSSLDPDPEGCPSGGARVDVGADVDADGVLDAGELSATQTICNGQHGLVLTSTLEPGDDGCPNGGFRTEAGIDADADGMLSESEISSHADTCNGVGALARARALAVGNASCPAGGLRIDTGLDENGNGTLDDSEAQQGEPLCLPDSVVLLGGGKSSCTVRGSGQGAQSAAGSPLWAALSLLSVLCVRRYRRRAV